jgi:hypothetical protein
VALVERIAADERERRRNPGTEDLGSEGANVVPNRVLHVPDVVPQEISQYLQGLVVEYLRASGGQASSRNVGRYLAANKSMEGSGGQTALEDLKRFYNSVAFFIQRHPQTFSRGDPRFDGKRAFSIQLTHDVHTAV